MNEMMPDTGRFVTTGVVDEAFLRENIVHVIARKGMIQLGAMYGVCILLALGCYALQRHVLHLVLAAICVVLLVTRVKRYHSRVTKLHLDRLRETAADGSVAYTVSCTEQGVRQENHTHGGVATLEWGSIDRAVETEGALMLISKAKQYVAFFKSELTEQECGELKAYLRSKGIKVKIK